MQPETTLKRGISDAVRNARAHGYRGTIPEYELTQADCEAIGAMFQAIYGRRPTRAEWRAAGQRYIGNAHYDG